MKTLSVFSSFAVNDLKPAKEFYGKKLGLSVKENKQMGLLEIKIAGGNHIMAYPKADHKPASFTVLNLVVKDIDKAVDELAKKGVKFVKYPGFGQDKKGISRADGRGPSIAWFKDPSGNVIAVFAI